MSSTSLANPANPPSSTDIYASPSATIILTIVLLLFFFIGFFSIYFCRCFMSNLPLTWYIRQNPSNTQENALDGPKPYPGLDPSIIETFPTFTYSSVKEYRKAKVGLECAICLCEFEDDNDLRLLPICCHVFHQECIDLWLESHKSCPFCRRALDTPLEKSPNVSAHGGGTLRQNSIPEHELLPDTYTVINIKDDNENERDGNDHKDGGTTAPTSGSEGTGESKAEKFARSKSTGHSIVRKGRGGSGEEEEDRFTLRLPEHVQAKLLRGHQGTRSCTTFGEFKSKTSAGNGGFGEVSLSTGDDKTGDDNKV